LKQVRNLLPVQKYILRCWQIFDLAGSTRCDPQTDFGKVPMKLDAHGSGKFASHGITVRPALISAANSFPTALICAASLLVLAASDSRAQYVGAAKTSASVAGAGVATASDLELMEGF
jgi:hypothetical protein